ncbi:DNA-directed RNA polymerase subunit beta [Paenibacillus sp.]|uniref:DNA-directed RNA polymerase subunit beta n=1 Tax=Paenibacillus sp. TaxID=58172 RepID=UPI002D2843BF|nr:DNA-directed RNA polymerase subunit beta [Paenibacillus sp.]HZG57518.1 DNA-directed RNA polymerase subunit beta [Paenibacillus sp.]
MSNAKQTKPKRKPLPKGLRIALKICRMLLFPLLLVVGVYAGLQIGYVRFGGGDPADVLEWETWKHMLDLVFAEQ